MTQAKSTRGDYGTSTTSNKSIQYYDSFMKNFVSPYSIAYISLNDETIFSRLKHFNSNFFRTPGTAFSTWSSSMSDNAPEISSLMDKVNNVSYKQRADKFCSNLHDSFNVVNINSDYDGARTRSIVKKHLTKIVNAFNTHEGKWYTKYLTVCYQLGACLYQRSLNWVTLDALLRNPKRFAAIMSSHTDYKTFKKSKNISNYIDIASNQLTSTSSRGGTYVVSLDDSDSGDDSGDDNDLDSTDSRSTDETSDNETLLSAPTKKRHSLSKKTVISDSEEDQIPSAQRPKKKKRRSDVMHDTDDEETSLLSQRKKKKKASDAKSASCETPISMTPRKHKKEKHHEEPVTEHESENTTKKHKNKCFTSDKDPESIFDKELKSLQKLSSDKKTEKVKKH